MSWDGSNFGISNFTVSLYVPKKALLRNKRKHLTIFGW